VDDETSRFIAIRKIKLARLHELNKQAAAFGEYNVPPQIAMEQGSLRDELGMMDSAIAAPARSEVTDELGPAGRFLVNYQQNRDIKQSIAALAVQLETGLAMHRNWIVLIGVAVLLILVAVVAIVTAIAMQGGL